MNEETFNWLMAMQLFSEGVELEIFFNDVWRNIDKGPSCVTFHSPFKYRRKPLPVATETMDSRDVLNLPIDIYEVANGYMVKPCSNGERDPTYVFTSLKSLCDWILTNE